MRGGQVLATTAVAASVAASLLVAAEPMASASTRCAAGIVGGSSLGDRAYGSCSSFNTSVTHVKITADCIAGPDRSTSWFHDYNLHYTGYCGTFGLTFKARGAYFQERPY